MSQSVELQLYLERATKYFGWGIPPPRGQGQRDRRYPSTEWAWCTNLWGTVETSVQPHSLHSTSHHHQRAHISKAFEWMSTESSLAPFSCVFFECHAVCFMPHG